MFKIGKMKVDNLVVLTRLYLPCIKMQLQHVGISQKCIKRVGRFPNKVMILVATLGIDVALT